jgi:GrpB-like predicted nucleotidyltransferase (UPF0157 family)
MVEIIDYSARWPAEFRRLGGHLRCNLGALAVRIDHIGSTSVPGLCAKDVLDVQVSVHELGPEIARRLSQLGFRALASVWCDHRPPGANGPDEDWQKLFFTEPVGERRINLHVRAIDRPNQRYALVFRDFLIAHAPTAVAYGELKRRLAVGLREERDYPEVKDPAVDLIYFAALRWAEPMCWQPGPSDA